MEKLLHERLREWSPEDGSACFADFVKGYETFVYHCISDCPTCASNAAKKLADEIERDYIPRPRFEDGTPLKNGDEIEYYGRAEKVVSYLVCDTTRDDVDYGMRHAYATLHLKCGASHNVPLGEPLKRPIPKVYDADGVAYEKGQTVYTLDSDIKMTVLIVDTNFDLEPVIQTNAGRYKPDQLTHEQPVFDADNKRIKVGDTVWHVGTGAKHLVEELTGDGGIYIDRSSLTWSGDMFTHREPDSLEKLLDDMHTFVAAKHPASSETLGGYCDRLTALIERGA